MMILELFRKNKTCKHDKVRPDADFSYCPDCGEMIENQWFITRCACCGIKLKATIKNGEILPDKHFCHNCGANAFIVEKLEKINFIDIGYAVLVKSVVKQPAQDITQSWVDSKTYSYTPGLLPQF